MPANIETKAAPRTTVTAAPEQSDAQRFQGQPLVQWFKLGRAMDELLRYRASGKHYTEAETSEPRSHKRWKAEAVALLRSLADGIGAGELEPVKVQKPYEDD